MMLCQHGEETVGDIHIISRDTRMQGSITATTRRRTVNIRVHSRANKLQGVTKITSRDKQLKRTESANKTTT
jgi:hypothetical protein